MLCHIYVSNQLIFHILLERDCLYSRDTEYRLDSQAYSRQVQSGTAELLQNSDCTDCCRLMVGSGMATGEWTGSGKWQEVTEAAMEIPSSLQQIESHDLTKIKELGRGQFGSVWLAR